jgi:hypothetical protein
MRTRGQCPTCGADRLLPGLDVAGSPICRDCAGIVQDFTCTRCGFEGALWAGHLCERRTLSDHLDRLLDDGTGRIHPRLLPLAEALLDMERPLTRLGWVRQRHVADLLQGLATGRVALAHDALQNAPHWQTVTYVRDLLMDSGVLPRADRQIFLYQRWLSERLSDVPDPEHRRLLHHFATWRQLHRLRAKAAESPLTMPQARDARVQVNQGDAFLTWLTNRGIALEEYRQADLDAWYAATSNGTAQRLLRWCMECGHMPKLVRALQTRECAPALLPSPRFRADTLRRVLGDQGLPLRTKVAAALVLLYAQPVTRLVRLTTDHITDDGTTLTIRLATRHPRSRRSSPTWSAPTSTPRAAWRTPAAAAPTGSSPAPAPASP